VQKLRRHLWEHREEFQRFLFQPAVPPTNNHAERMLRPAVISRKVGGCNKTLLGACVHGVLASLMVTLHQRGRRFLELALRRWRSPEAEAVALEGLPAVGAVSGVQPGPPCPACGVRAVAFAPSG
jgi:hypothetical protein